MSYCPEHDRFQCSLCPSNKSERAEELERYARARRQIWNRKIARQRARACRHGQVPGINPPCRSCEKALHLSDQPSPGLIERARAWLRRQ